MAKTVGRDRQRERTAERRQLALQLRKDGHSYRIIGEMLATQFANQQNLATFSAHYAKKLVHEAIKDVYKDDVSDLIKLEMERLDGYALEALDVLRAEHVVVSAGAVVRTNVRDEVGRLVFDPSTGLPATQPLIDHAPRLQAIDRLLKIQERRARLLGLDKPTKVAPTNPDGTKEAKGAQVIASPVDLNL